MPTRKLNISERITGTNTFISLHNCWNVISSTQLPYKMDLAPVLVFTFLQLCRASFKRFIYFTIALINVQFGTPSSICAADSDTLILVFHRLLTSLTLSVTRPTNRRTSSDKEENPHWLPTHAHVRLHLSRIESSRVVDGKLTPFTPHSPFKCFA